MTMVQSLRSISTSRRRHLITIFAGLSVALVLAVACYWPSLDGPFIFDDVPNLELLGERGGLTTADRAIEFITSGISGPLGRPISLASFTLDGQTWPTDPRPFRVTNLIIHLVNGLLVFFLARAIFSTVQNKETANLVALVCASIWLLHPLLVSTTAYIVQRMTLLSGLFTLSGLLCYMRGRQYLPAQPLRGWLWVCGGLGLFGLLALLSKESGVLLPLYALVIEVTVFSRVELLRHQRKALLTLLLMPLIALLTYTLFGWDEIVAGFEFRPYSVGERILTQAVVLLDYLRQIAAPQLSGLGIIHDDFPISHGLLNPVSTIASFIVLVGLLVFAVWSRKKWPIVSLGLLWFFVGHSLEAGPFPLELYFEHRNYLPLMGPVIAVCSLLPFASLKAGRLVLLPLALFVLFESFLTWQAATTWSSEQRFMQTALAEHPESLRAQQYVANQYIIDRQFSEALAAQESLAKRFPHQASIRMSILNLRCILGVLTAEQIGEVLKRLERSNYDRQVIGYLAPLTANAESKTCSAFGLSELDAVFDALLRAPKIAASEAIRGAVYYHKGIAYQRAGALDRAIEQLDLSYEANPEGDVLMNQVVWLVTAGRSGDAERYLTRAREHAAGRFWTSEAHEADLHALQQLIERNRKSPE